MKNSIAHRGPDSEGVRLFKHCGIAHTRLAIIDLLGGIQPMCRKLDGYSYHIVYNGELYNTGRLRKKLMNAGWSFVSGSDTEVILLSFLQYGPEFVKKLDGIFALLKMVQLYLLQNQKGFLNTLALKQSWIKTALMKFLGLGLREYLVRAFLRGYMRLNQAVI